MKNPLSMLKRETPDEKVTRLEAELATAQAKVKQARVDAEQLALDGADLEARAAARQALRDAEDDVTATEGALKQAKQLVVDAKVKADKAADDARRKADDEWCQDYAGRLRAVFVKHEAVTQECRAITTEGLPKFPSVLMLHNWVEQVGLGQPLDAANFIAAEIEGHGKTILLGSARLLPKDQPKVEPLAAATPRHVDTVLVFTLNGIAFTSPETGELSRIARGTTVRLLPHEAALGIRRGKVAPHDPRDRKQQQIAATFSSAPPEWFHCYSLIDDAMVAAPDITLSKPAKSSSFDPAIASKFGVEIKHGPAFQVPVAASPHAVAARKKDDDK